MKKTKNDPYRTFDIKPVKAPSGISKDQPRASTVKLPSKKERN